MSVDSSDNVAENNFIIDSMLESAVVVSKDIEMSDIIPNTEQDEDISPLVDTNYLGMFQAVGHALTFSLNQKKSNVRKMNKKAPKQLTNKKKIPSCNDLIKIQRSPEFIEFLKQNGMKLDFIPNINESNIEVNPEFTSSTMLNNRHAASSQRTFTSKKLPFLKEDVDYSLPNKNNQSTQTDPINNSIMNYVYESLSLFYGKINTHNFIFLTVITGMIAYKVYNKNCNTFA